MLLHIQHETRYRYDHPVKYSIQRLLLTPRQDGAQRTQRWRLTASGSCHAGLDAFGNQSHLVVVNAPHSEVVIQVDGEVASDAQPWFADRGELPLPCYLQDTALTRPDAALTALAEVVKEAAAASDFPGRMQRLMQAIEDRIRYVPGSTDTTTTAAEALARGSGVCQDHAQVLIACARQLGFPARYVSGYLYTGDAEHLASHAWADVWSGEQWLACDTTHKRFTDHAYCRLAVGRDYLDACPVRGMRRGGGAEHMQAHVLVSGQ